MRLKLKDLAEVIGGEILQGSPELMIKGVSTDSREDCSGKVFFALRGERFDGHRFIRDVARKGALAGVVRSGFRERALRNFGLIEVPDTLFALGELARYVRSRLNLKVVGITGSVGKTTTKEMTALILSRRFRTYASRGNFNNLIGLPLSIFEMPGDTEVAVLELASNQAGEIMRLSDIAQPEIGLITRIAEAHLSGFKDIDGVEMEKRALVTSLGAKGIFIFNMNDERLCRLARGFAGKKVGYGVKAKGFKDVDVSVIGEGVKVVKKGEGFWQRFRVRIFSGRKESGIVEINGLGEHLVEDALGGIAVGAVMGVSVSESSEALSQFKPLSGRGKLEEIRDGLWMIDESYNANPASVREALRVFDEYGRRIKGKRVLILGEMKELGERAGNAHKELGEFLRWIDFDELYYIGCYSRELGAGLGRHKAGRLRVAEDISELKGWLKDGLDKGLILVKASHILGFSEISDWLRRGADAL